jgi:SHS2 domain-containing protein
MPYQYLEDIATADVAFQAWGETLEEVFISAADATMNIMVEDLKTISPIETRVISLKDETIKMLLFQFLQEFIYYKDADKLLLRVGKLQIAQHNNRFTLTAEALGETIDPQKHELNLDVKAVTLHRFQVQELPTGWEASVVLDI